VKGGAVVESSRICATVYRAHDTKGRREVAAEGHRRHFALGPDRLARFTREAQVLASLDHSHLAAIR